MRVLHLIDPASPGGGACTLRLLADVTRRLTSVAHDVIVLGHRSHVELAERCDVPVRGSILPPRMAPFAAKNAIRRTIKWYEAAQGPYDIIHAWTVRSASLATLAAPAARRLAVMSVGPVSGVEMQWFCHLLRRHPMPLLFTSEAVQREYQSLGLPRRELALLPAGVAPEQLDSASRTAIRDQWNVSNETFLLGLLSEPVTWADVRLIANAVAQVALSGRAVRLVAHPAALRRAEAESWCRSIGLDALIVLEDDLAEPWRIAAALDGAVFFGGELNAMDLSDAGRAWSILLGGGRRLRPMPGVQPLLWAMAAGLPVIAEASHAVRQIIEDGRTGLLVNQFDITGVAHHFDRLLTDRTIAGRLGAAAAARIRESFHISAFCVRLKQAYELHLAGRPVRVIDDGDDPIIERADAEKPIWISA